MFADDFFETEISSDNFLKPALSNLFESLDSQPLSSSLDAMRKRLFLFIQKKFNLYVDGREEMAETGGVNLNMCEGTKFNLMEEDMPVVVLPEDMHGSSARTESVSAAGGKGVSFADDCAHQGGSQSSNEENDVEQRARNIRGKWNEIDIALGLSPAARSTDGEDNNTGGRMQVVDESELLPPVPPNQNINPNADERDSRGTGGSSEPSADDSVRSSLALQSNMFSWRYPLLFDEMTRNNSVIQSSPAGVLCGQEDLTMTAMRIIEATPLPDSVKSRGSQGGGASATLSSSSLDNTNSNTNNVNVSKTTLAAGRDESEPEPALRAEAMRFVRDEVSLW